MFQVYTNILFTAICFRLSDCPLLAPTLFGGGWGEVLDECTGGVYFNSIKKTARFQFEIGLFIL